MVEDTQLQLSNKLKNRPKLYKNDCIFYINDDVNLLREELDFGFKAWTNFHSSIVGFKPMDFKSEPINVTMPSGEIVQTEKFSIENERTSKYSMIDFVGAFIHRCYLEKFSQS